MAQIKSSGLNIILLILVVITFFNIKTVLQDMEEEPMKPVTAAAAAETQIQTVAAAETQTQTQTVAAAETQTQTRSMTLAEREQMEIEKLEKDNAYCSYCIYADDIKCAERIEYLKKRYGTGYLEGLKEVLEKGKECNAKGLRQWRTR